jgi:hypothetical protein
MAKKPGITRRDFLDGVAVSAAGLAAAAASPHLTGAEAMMSGHGGTSGPLPPGYYPPASTGITGQPDDVIADAIKIDGHPQPRDVHSTKGGPGIFAFNARDVDEDDYDLVVVGAGASGIAAAKWYQDRFGADSKILLIDSLPDFGGHSHRNEFHIPDATNGGADVMLLRNGGTVNLDSIGAWNQARARWPRPQAGGSELTRTLAAAVCRRPATSAPDATRSSTTAAASSRLRARFSSGNPRAPSTAVSQATSFSSDAYPSTSRIAHCRQWQVSCTSHARAASP